MYRGACNCGEVTFTVARVLNTSACHCGQCRKQSGHHWASGNAREADVTIKGAPKWFAASDTAKRGFCGNCGSFLFWTAHDEDTISFSLGALEHSEGLKIDRHIFTKDKGDYYEIADSVPQREN